VTKVLNRRSALKAAAGLSVAGLTTRANAQVTGTVEGGGTVPLRLPLGALDYLDRNQYISNMEIIAHIPGAAVSGGEPMTAMWAKGKRRLISGGGAWLDVTEPKKAAMVARGGDPATRLWGSSCGAGGSRGSRGWGGRG